MSHDHDHPHEPVDWKLNGVRVIKGNQLDTNTAQTPGMNRAAAINYARVGAQKIWAGTVHIHANAKTGAHHHGALESVIYVLKGEARMRWGERLAYVAEAAGARQGGGGPSPRIAPGRKPRRKALGPPDPQEIAAPQPRRIEIAAPPHG